ncbi:MAG TPA: hypothetical protein VLL96_06135, partial [Candidatus Deferrimicrobiaceae bacterium]|nr:hypothetical protein [Candidatus Deferrimicrobiaceae bacterium]
MEGQKFKITDLFAAIVIPIILVLLIFVLAVYVNPGGDQHVLGEAGLGGTIAVILSQGFAQMIVLGIPLVLGLLWNKWAGGAAGFIMGGMYYVAAAGQYNGLYSSMGVTTYNFFGDISMLFYLVNAVLIGYIAGSLTNGSTNFKRMIGAGLTAAITTAVVQAYMNYTVSLEPARLMAQGSWVADPVNAFVIAFVPSIALGVIVPILAKVMTWYGL